jgi:glycosyltransferase involved in cell wall biosynthesis
VTLLCFTRPDDDPAALEHLRTFCQGVQAVPIRRSRPADALALLASLFASQPFVIRRDSLPQMHRLVSSLLPTSRRRPFDFIHSDQLWMAQYVPRLNVPTFERSNVQPLNVQPSNLQTVLDAHNATFQIFQRLAQRERNPIKRLVLEREWRALRRYEARLCASFDHLVAVTEQDRSTLERLNVTTFISGAAPSNVPTSHVIPICVDTQSLQPVVPCPGALDVLHLGTMFWMPNVEGVSWFIREAWPQVKALVPAATFTIAGKRPPESLRRLAEAAGSVSLAGYVPDPQPYLENCAAFIVPLHSGSGMRVKIVEAWARGLPVVSTTVGAEGLEYRDGENILIADGGEAFARAVARLLADPDLNQRLRVNGRRWAEERYEWRTVYRLWDEIYKPRDTDQKNLDAE